MRRILSNSLWLAVLVVWLALPGISYGQDTTCNAGDIAWVKDTENADEGILGGTNSAEYNNFDAPWGIQAVFDEGCIELVIRIVKGANNYGPSSASWNNRDAADKQINVDTIDCGGFDGSPACDVLGYVNATTACGSAGNQWTANCPVPLDFGADTITGADGFKHGSAGDQYTYRWIRVQNVDGEGFNAAAASNIHFFHIAVVDAGTNAVRVGTDRGTLSYSYLADFGDDGVVGSPHDSNISPYVMNRINCDTAGSPGGNQDGWNVNDGRIILLHNVIKNCDIGFKVLTTDFQLWYYNTFRNIVGDCIFYTSNLATDGAIVGNVFQCGGDGIDRNIGVAGRFQLIAGNVFDVTGDQFNVTTVFLMYDQDDILNDNGLVWDTLGCEFTGDDDESLNAACVERTLYPLNKPAGLKVQVGAIRPAAGGGGGGGGGSGSHPTHEIGGLGLPPGNYAEIFAAGGGGI